uniref:Putative glycine rich protein n=1 Tax=Ixodes ricinus TaxID=34613 RepID=A0A0K8R6U1_IXORI
MEAPRPARVDPDNLAIRDQVRQDPPIRPANPARGIPKHPAAPETKLSMAASRDVRWLKEYRRGARNSLNKTVTI